MNNRHIQTFLTVSAAFFAMSAPLHSNAACNASSGATNRAAQYALSVRADKVAGNPTQAADEADQDGERNPQS